MKLILMVVCGLVLGFLGVGSSLAESYQCTFKPSRIEKGLIPAKLRIDWPDSSRPARITDTITEVNGFDRVWTKIPVENGKRVTFSWVLENLNVPNLAKITATRKEIVSINYRASVYSTTSKVVLTVRADHQNGHIRAEGRCKVLR